MRLPIGAAGAFLIAGCHAAPAAAPVVSTTSTAPAASPPVTSSPMASSPVASSPVAAGQVPELAFKSVDLPGATAPVGIDLIAYERGRARVWVPVGDTGSVDVFDIGSRSFQRVDGFKTERREVRGRQRTLGPSAAAVGDGVAYVGNRGTNEVCAVDAPSLKMVGCVKLPTPADFLTYVAPAKELWVTTPKDQSLTVLDASVPASLKSKLVISGVGSVEGAAVDATHGIYYTNLEDKNQTMAFDIASHAIKATWSSGCSDAPHGIAVDPTRGWVIVACSNGLRIFDASKNGEVVGTLDTGDGVDDIDYDATKQRVVVAASKARRLTVAHIGGEGQATIVAVGSTSDGVRNAVADTAGNVYAADAQGARLLVFDASR